VCLEEGAVLYRDDRVVVYQHIQESGCLPRSAKTRRGELVTRCAKIVGQSHQRRHNAGVQALLILRLVSFIWTSFALRAGLAYKLDDPSAMPRLSLRRARCSLQPHHA
jgi:hypothetical protein